MKKTKTKKKYYMCFWKTPNWQGDEPLFGFQSEGQEQPVLRKIKKKTYVRVEKRTNKLFIKI